MDQLKKMYKEKYHFFLTELFIGLNDEGGLVTELMRAAGNIVDLRKLTLSISPRKGMSCNQEEEHLLSTESVIIYTLNLNGAQLREALKLFGELTNTKLYQEFKSSLRPSQVKKILPLQDIVDSYKYQGNYIHDVLKPLRDIVFHYDTKKAYDWVISVMEDEKEKKPPISYMHPDHLEFGPGIDYNEHIFSKHLFLPSERKSIFQNQQIMQDLQLRFLYLVKLLSKYLLKRAKIEKREDGWYMNYMYGFRR